jgi:hypothetical protein
VYSRQTMLRLLLLALLIAAPATASADRAPEPKPAPKKPAPAGDQFPIPKDASGPESAAGGGGKIQTYQVARAKDAVLGEVRDALKAGGWTITKDETSPRGAVRLEVKKGDKIWKASFLGDTTATKTAIVLTLP